VEHLRTNTATLQIEDAGVDGGRLSFDVVVENLAGHKLPTAYPSRRAWIHVVVRDASGRTVFESGAVRPDGSIEGNDADADADSFEPHHTVVRSEDQVQVYESVMGDLDGRPTTGLLTAASYLKDNRVLPTGFDKLTADADVAVHGGASDDADFLGGSDRTRYDVNLGGAEGLVYVEATLRYQPISYRWARNLDGYSDLFEPARFVRYYDSMAGASSTPLATVRATVTSP
jgi:hypothetical protein